MEGEGDADKQEVAEELLQGELVELGERDTRALLDALGVEVCDFETLGVAEEQDETELDFVSRGEREGDPETVAVVVLVGERDPKPDRLALGVAELLLDVLTVALALLVPTTERV
jgi:hypothetical protein